MKNLLQALFACGIVLLLVSCNGKVKDGRILYGTIHDSTDKALANHNFFLSVEKRSGFLTNAISRWESFKFTTDSNGFFNVTYSSQNNAGVEITEYIPSAVGGEDLRMSWRMDGVPKNTSNVGVIKLKKL
jgi:hypothetical protein